MTESVSQPVRRRGVDTMRAHDYLYDSNYIVSGARDYARTAFKAAMASAQVSLQPVYKTMFSEMRMFPRMQVVYYPNCRLPDHMDRSYGAYMLRVQQSRLMPAPQTAGKDQFKFTARPKVLLDVPSVTPDLHAPTPAQTTPREPAQRRHRGTQSKYRESSAQTIPWQPDGQPADNCETKPEVLYLDKLEWGPGKPYRLGDLPADFHTTEIINKLRHARKWTQLVEKGEFPRWLKKRDDIISDVETKDWIFREAEIDELQDIRLELLHKIQQQNRTKQQNRTSRKLAKLWAAKKDQMESKISHIRHTRDRELRKLQALHDGGGRVGLVQRMRAARGAGSVTQAASDPTSDLHAPLARHGYQARRRHTAIYYDPSLLAYEDHQKIAEPPAWLEQCGQDLRKSCSGHHLPRDPMQLCERETKWSEQFLETLHNDLKKARLGAASCAAGPLHVLKPRRLVTTPRPATPEVDVVQDDDEACHQAALTLQRIIRGRAVQTLMYEGRTRAAELTEELKTTHGLQREDKIRIAKEEARARDYHVVRTESDQKDDAITALVDELCGGAVAAALDFLEKELRRLKEERRQHAFILIALRDKVMREAAEAGRRQKEEHRRREHDEMFKQVLGVTQDTVDAYLHDIVTQGVELAAEQDAVRRARDAADEVDRLRENEAMSTAEQNELVAELVQQFLLPEAHKCATRHRISSLQAARTEAARKTIFGVIDEAEIKEIQCVRCGRPLDELCRCRTCKVMDEPVETILRLDPRWKFTRGRPHEEPKTRDERYPPQHEIRCMLNALVDEGLRLTTITPAVKRRCGLRWSTSWIFRFVNNMEGSSAERALNTDEPASPQLPSNSDGLSCNVCQKSFDKLALLVTHIVVNHPGRKDQEVVISKATRRSRRSGRSKQNGLYMVHRALNTDEPASPQLPSSSDGLSCNVCQKSFDKLALLVTHIVVNHPGRKDQEVAISKATRRSRRSGRSKQNGLYMVHRVFTTNRPFACEVCTQRFAYKYQLLAHSGTHTADEARYICDLCNREFFVKEHLIAHFHTKPYDPSACDLCGKKFASWSQLLNHRLEHSS